MRVATLAALGLAGCATSAFPALAWTLEAKPGPAGDPPSCLIRSDKHEVAVTHYRWPVGEPTTLLTVGAARGDGPLEVSVDRYGPVSGRALDRRVWSRPDLIAAMKAGNKMRAAWTNHKGQPATAEIDLAGLSEALAECDAALDAAKAK